MGQGSSQLLTHTWIMNMAQKPWYITKKGMKRKEKKKQKEGGGGKNTTVERKEEP